MISTKILIRVSEHYKSTIPLEESEKFSIEEIEILEKEFSKSVQVMINFVGKQSIQTKEYVGYIILPHHIISIAPKIPQISFINMLKYAIGLGRAIPDYLELSEEENYYDIVVLFFIKELEKLLYQGLKTGYEVYEDNLSCIRGKILFKEHLTQNYNRCDKVFCSFSELTIDIHENRIIKYTLYYLSQGYFLDDTIDSKLLNYYNRTDAISLISDKSTVIDSFKLIEFTPLNEHYRPILSLCELLLTDSSIDEETMGGKTSNSFLVDMNLLFEKFVANLFKERLKETSTKLGIKEQKTEYADIADKELQLKLDILISYNKKPIMILDTKYKEFEGTPDTSHIAQLALYSISTGVKNCCLIYAGKAKEIRLYSLHQNIKLHTLSFDLQAFDKYEFETKCSDFINSMKSILQPIIEKEAEC